MLAINTAFLDANLALQTEKGVSFKTIDAKAKHSENVLKTIDEMCQELGENINNVGVVAVVTGPGSFTGLRIGVAIAQALGCVNENLKYISISSLKLMAYKAIKSNMCDGDFVCVLNALSGLYFVCKFDKNGIMIDKEQMIDQDQFNQITCQKIALVGDLKSDEFKFVEITSQDLLKYANLKDSKGEYVPQEEMLPSYLRLSQAEDSLLKKSKKDL